ncbi:MurT ligase domain-containing protein [Furfurilactobacillus sp. WILCCON 0119]
MSLRSGIATAVGKSSYWFLHTFLHGGSSLPGKLATRIDPELLKTLGKNYDVIVITGTNGKTLTTALTVRVLREKYDDVLTNPTGSNMEQGIVGTFLHAKRAHGSRPLAVLEVDEANVIKVTQYIKPIAFVFTNIFRDQMDRYGEIYTTYKKILDGVKLAPEATIIANGDAQLFNSVDLPNPKIFYGFNHLPKGDMLAPTNTDGILCPNCEHVLHYHFMTYGNLGDYFCPNCGFERPALTYAVTKLGAMTPTSSAFDLDGESFNIGIGGLYNIYNALAAYAVGRFLDVSPAQIRAAFTSDERVFGRQEVVHVGNKDVTLILIKNPVGVNQVIDMILTEPADFSFVGLLNANYADGIDTSWIWDGEFEKLGAAGQGEHPKIKAFMTGGERYKDITFRLQVAGVDHPLTEPDLGEVTKKIQQLPTDKVYVLATYTAILQLRKLWASEGLIKEGMGA